MADFMPKAGDMCLLQGNKVLYVGKGLKDNTYIFENDKGSLQKFDSLDFFEPIDELYDQISEICFKTVMVSNTTSMHEAIKKLYDADMLKLPSEDIDND